MLEAFTTQAISLCVLGVDTTITQMPHWILLGNASVTPVFLLLCATPTDSPALAAEFKPYQEEKMKAAGLAKIEGGRDAGTKPVRP